MTAVVRMIAVGLVVLSLGLHWGFLQTVAWMGMVITYSRDAALTDALAKTFDGRHPCSLCKKVTEGSSAERKQTVEMPLKIELAVPQLPSLLFPPTPRNLSAPHDDKQLTWCDVPPSPPPRTA